MYQVAIEASDTIDLLECVASSNDTPLRYRWDKRAALGLHQFGSSIDIELREVAGQKPASPPFQLLGRLLQQVFLGMNLALPGSSSFVLTKDEFPTEEHAPPNLSSNVLEFAYSKARERGWPPLRRLELSRVWDWLHGAMLYELDIAAEPVDKALFALLRVCVPQTVYTDNILHIAQAYEGLFAEGRDNIGSILRQRIETVLGQSQTHKRWFSKFYELRSRIAHGSIPVLRPAYCNIDHSQAVEDYIAQFWEPIDQAIAVLLAILQDLIINESRGYHFGQQVTRVRS